MLRQNKTPAFMARCIKKIWETQNLLSDRFTLKISNTAKLGNNELYGTVNIRSL